MHLLSVAIERGQNVNDARAEVRRFFDAVQSALHSYPFSRYPDKASLPASL